jgi:RNA polymerase primary sigma factor
MDILVDAIESGPEARIVNDDMRRAVAELLTQLPERQARILQMRFGIGVRDDCTLEQIARQQGVTRERIRQLEAQALTSLRALSSTWALRGCLN